jgi:hypothetical protein
MKREDDYRTNAAASLYRALRATSIADKSRLLRMAEAWLELAERAHKVAEPMRDMADHPLVCETRAKHKRNNALLTPARYSQSE